ncbi:MAG: alpha/beta fold hydrolase [Cryobacterium sp.]|nr:alpha/beta fold hydrolase [Oligoflexia bacterium]
MSATHPEIDFWDQTQVTGPDAYSDLKIAALMKFDALFAAAEKPISLIAHSFGSHLLRYLVQVRGDQISTIKLYSAGHDLIADLERLAERLAEQPSTPPDLTAELLFSLEHPPSDLIARLWNCAQLIAKDPAFMRLYWPTTPLFQKYQAITKSAPPLNFKTFRDVTTDFLKQKDSLPNSTSWKGSATLVLGQKDPLLDPSKTRAYWESVFPKLQTELRPESGHYPHLERFLR